MHGRLAFVLRATQNNDKVIILDSEQGKLELYKKTNLPIYNGLLIRWESSKQQLIIIEALPLPIQFNQNLLSFYHFVLEICSNYIPIGLVSVEVFELIYFLYFNFQIFINHDRQKIFVVRLFCVLGLGVDGIRFRNLLPLLSIPIDRINKQEIDLEIEKELDVFIEESLDFHTLSYKFKTRLFYKKVGTV